MPPHKAPTVAPRVAALSALPSLTSEVILQNIADAVITIDPAFCITRWNRAAEDIYGWKAAQVIGKAVGSILLTEYHHSNQEEAMRHLEQYGYWRGEVTQRRSDGTPLTIQASVTWLTNAEGESLGAVSVNRDITSEKLREKALLKREQRYRSIVQATADVVWDWDLVEDRVWWSQEVSTLLGYPAGEVSAERSWWIARIHPDDRASILTSIHALFQSTRERWSGEYRFRKADGAYVWLLDKARVQRTASGQVCRMVGGMIDITASRRTSVVSHEDKEPVTKIPHPDAVAPRLTDPSDELLSLLNDQIVTLRDQLPHTAPLDSPPPRRPGWEVTTTDGCVREEGKAAPPRVPNPDEKEQQEAALWGSQVRFLQLTESLPQLVWTCQPDGTCDYLSKRWVAYTGIPEQQQLGFGWLHQVHPEDREATLAAWQQAVKEQADFRAEFRIRRHDGEYHWFDTMASRWYNEAGRLEKWFGSNTNIQDKKALEIENQRVNEELDKFVYSTTHDLRSPLVGIMGLITLARDESISATLQDYLRKMQTNVEKLDGILQNILEYYYNVQCAVEVAPVDLEALVKHCMAPLEDLPEFENVETRIMLPAEKVMGDPYRLETILRCLIRNALQFQDQQKQNHQVQVTIRVAERLSIVVQDNGIGISKASLADIFRMYYRGTNLSRGAGLGLYVVRSMVRKLKGRISVDSHPGQGTIFTVSLPLSHD